MKTSPLAPAADNDLVTVIVATYNSAATLEACLRSVLDQTYGPKELVVVDGGSTDGTLDILRKYADRLAYWVSEPDTGVYEAWNKGLRQSRGNWICFLGSDDFLWTPDVLEKIAPRLRQAEARGVRYVYGEIAILTRTGTEPLAIEGRPWEEARKTYGEVMSVTHSGSFHHRGLFMEHGLFDESFRIAGDFDFMLRELPGRDALFAPETIVLGMRMGGLCSSLSTKRRLVDEVIRARAKNGVRSFSWRVGLWRFRVGIACGLLGVLGEDRVAILTDAYRRLMGKRPCFRS